MVHRVQLTYEEIMHILDIKSFPAKRTGITLPPGIYELSNINKTLEYFLPAFVKVSITIDDIRIKSNLKVNQTLLFNKIFIIQFYDLLNRIQVH